MYCKNCGNKLDDDAIFCSKCGVRKETEGNAFYCEKCGTKISEGDVFCTGCGNLVSEDAIKKDKEEKQKLEKERKEKEESKIGIVILVATIIFLLLVAFFSNY